MIKGAVLSSCKRYRYRLWRTWDESKPVLVFIMLNPSTAGEHADDPTVRRCIGFGERLGFGGIEVVNLFAWRATDPKKLKREKLVYGDIVGPENDRFINFAVMQPNATVVFAWGTHGQDYIDRVLTVRAIVRHHLFDRGVEPMCLGYTGKTRMPRHPLMLSYATQLEGYVG